MKEKYVIVNPVHILIPHVVPVSQMLWLSFAVVWDMALFDLTSSAVEEALYLSCDFGAKVSHNNTCHSKTNK